jgi:hypothetical protein
MSSNELDEFIIELDKDEFNDSFFFTSLCLSY